jgi:outer membrane protein
MKTTHHTLLAAAAIIAAIFTVPSFADDNDVYSNSFRVGSETVFYHTKASDLAGPYVPAGVNFNADNLETLYVGFIRRVTSAFSVELALGYPPLSKVEGRGPATVGSVPYNGQVISSARWLSPTVLFEYNFLPESSKLRPYIGIGVNYTQFYDRNSTAQGDAASGGPTKISLSASVGPAATAGVVYSFTRHWHVNASYSISQVDTNIVTDTAGVERTARLHFGPQVLVISGGYAF